MPSEQVFSVGSNQIWARRNRLTAFSVEKIMFLLKILETECSFKYKDEIVGK